mgnify:FL=1
MSFNAAKWAWDQDLKPSAKFVLLALADCLNERTGRLNPSISAISEKTGQNRKTIISSLSILEGLGLIVKAKTFGTSTSYQLNLDVLCSAENGTGMQKDTSTKNGTRAVPKTVLDQTQKRDTNQEEPRKNQELLGAKPLKQKVKVFRKPSLQQITDYKNQLIFEGQKCTSDIQSFIDYHESKGWVVGKSSMKCWQAAFRTWERNHQKWVKQNANKQSVTERRIGYASNLYDYEKATNFQ